MLMSQRLSIIKLSDTKLVKAPRLLKKYYAGILI